MAEIVSLTKKRLQHKPVVYNIVFRHDHEGMSFVVYDIQDTKKDRLAVARDLAACAEILQQDEEA